jgi:hypothetical protein
MGAHGEMWSGRLAYEQFLGSRTVPSLISLLPPQLGFSISSASVSFRRHKVRVQSGSGGRCWVAVCDFIRSAWGRRWTHGTGDCGA